MTTVPSNADGTSMLALLKKLYPQKRITRDWSLKSPLFAMLTKVDDFEGTDIQNPLQHSGPSRSRSFEYAQNYRYPASSVVNTITRIADYGIGRINAETMLAMRSNAGAFVRLLENTMGNALESLEKSTRHGVYRNKGGAIGVISAIGNGAATNDKITLVSKTDAQWFAKGQKLQAASTDGTSGSLRDSGDMITVNSVDFAGGIVYVDENSSSAITGLTAGDYLFNAGDFGVSFSGLDGWIPTTAPTVGGGDSFFGVDRSANVLQLAGSRITDTSMTIQESMQELAAMCSFGGTGNPTKAFMNPLKVNLLAQELDAKVLRDPGGEGEFGFSGITMSTAAGMVKVYSDPACPLTKYYLLDLETWKLHNLGGLPHLVTDDGLSTRTVFNADQVELRVRLFGNIVCLKPSANGVGVLAA